MARARWDCPGPESSLCVHPVKTQIGSQAWPSALGVVTVEQKVLPACGALLSAWSSLCAPVIVCSVHLFVPLQKAW